MLTRYEKKQISYKVFSTIAEYELITRHDQYLVVLWHLRHVVFAVQLLLDKICEMHQKAPQEVGSESPFAYCMEVGITTPVYDLLIGINNHVLYRYIYLHVCDSMQAHVSWTVRYQFQSSQTPVHCRRTRHPGTRQGYQSFFRSFRIRLSHLPTTEGVHQ